MARGSCAFKSIVKHCESYVNPEFAIVIVNKQERQVNRLGSFYGDILFLIV